MNSSNPARRLTRSRDDRFIGGVAAGIANYFNIDPVLIRVTFLVSIAFGGFGVLAYLALLALVPIDGDANEPVMQPSGGKRFLVVAGTILLGIIALASIGGAGLDGWFFGIGPGPLFGIVIWGLAIAGVVWLIREATSGDNAISGAFGRPGSPPPASPPASPTPAGFSKSAAMNLPHEPKTEKLESSPDDHVDETAVLPEHDPETAALPEPDDETTVLPERDDETVVIAESPTQNAPAAPTAEMKAAGLAGSVSGSPTPQQNPGGTAGSTIGKIMTWFAIGVSAMIIFSVMALVSAWITAEFGAIPMAVLVMLFGAGLVVAAVKNRRQLAVWMLAAALVVAVPMAAISIADIRIEGGYGDLTEEPVTAAEIPDDGYRMAAGAMTIDLRRFPFSQGRTVDLPVRSGLGATSVIIPDDVCVSGRIEGKAGYSEIRGVEASGAGVDRTFSPVENSNPGLNLEAEFQLGFFEVIDATTWGRNGSFGEREGSGPFDDATGRRSEDTSSVSGARQRALAACAPEPASKPRTGPNRKRQDSSRT